MDAAIQEVAGQLDRTRWAACILDTECRLVWVSDEMKVLVGEADDAKLGIGKHILEAWMEPAWTDSLTPESRAASFVQEIPYILASTPGGKDEVRRYLEPEFQPILDHAEPIEPPPLWVYQIDYVTKKFQPTTVRAVVFSLTDGSGTKIGTVQLYGSALPARILSLVARGDEGMFMRMANLVEPGRRQAAVLFADLQDSGVLSRRLPSAAYFALIAAITDAMDEVVISHKGIVGKHTGDGATAFFLADDLGSSSSAARAAIEAARDISTAVATAAKRVASEIGLIEVSDLSVNVGVHWGGTLYMGQLVTGGRLEVTALGDAVNECARIQGLARDGEALVSKELIEHLSEADGEHLGLDADTLIYRSVAEMPGARAKDIRDAGTIAVTTLLEPDQAENRQLDP